MIIVIWETIFIEHHKHELLDQLSLLFAKLRQLLEEQHILVTELGDSSGDVIILVGQAEQHQRELGFDKGESAGGVLLLAGLGPSESGKKSVDSNRRNEIPQ